MKCRTQSAPVGKDLCGPGSAAKSPAGPAPSSGGGRLELARTIGNRAFGRVLQARLKVGASDDPYEREADRVADAVMRMAEPARPKAGACGGRCPACLPKTTAQPKLRVSQPGDFYEREADRLADQVMRLPEKAPGVPEEEDEERPPAVQREADVSVEEDEEADEEDLIRAKADGRAGATPEAAALVRGLRGGGAPLPADVRGFFERRMGYDFGAVRVHAGRHGAEACKAVHARAFAYGSDVAFATGQYAPQSRAGRHLLAHELAHVVQQGRAGAMAGGQAAMPVARQIGRPQVQRDDVDEEQESLQFLQGGWRAINALGIVYKPGPLSKDGGANLRRYPTGPVITWLPQNTKVHILKGHAERGWYAVTTVGDRGGLFGYIATSHLWRHLPDPEADVLKLEAGDTPLDVARAHYSKKGFNIWGKDPRYVVNALVWVNNHARHNTPHEPGIRKPGRLSDPWFIAETGKGIYIWLPGPDHLDAIYEMVAKRGGGTGSLTADLWRGIKNALDHAAYGLAFVGGLVHGFFKSLYDAVAGLVELVGGLLKSILTGEVLKDARELWEAVSKLTWKDIKAALGAWADKWERKLNSGSPWVAGHAHGYLTGYIMAEAAQLLISGGALTALKGALWSTRLAKAIKATRAFQALAKGIGKAGAATGRARELMGQAATAVRLSKPFKVLGEARAWVRRALILSSETVKDLSLDAINRLRTLSDDALDRLSRLAQPLKRSVLGCTSPCKVDVKVISEFLKQTARKSPKGAKTLKTIDDVLKALPADVDNSLIRKKLKKHRPLMLAITESGLTDPDLKVIGKFLTGADSSNPATAYRTFTRTLTALVPAKVGRDIRTFNRIADALVEANVRMGSALKGSMFESFAKLHLRHFRGIEFKRATFSKSRHKMLNKTRTSDAFIEVGKGGGELWDFKHTVGKVPLRQYEDYLYILKRRLQSTQGKVVASVNYLFPTKEVAKLNADLIQEGFGVYYITPSNSMRRLK